MMKNLTKEVPVFLTDGGLETTLIFQENLELPEFAAFPLLRDQKGISLIREYYRKYLRIAADFGTGFILETPTWRANSDWGNRLGYNETELAEMNHLAVSEMNSLRSEFASSLPEIRVSGCLGPRGDGYKQTSVMSEREAQDYHSTQIRQLAEEGVDCLTAMTLNYTEEAIGIGKAAKSAGIRSVISFTVETDGSLVTGESLKEAIKKTDAKTDGAVDYYMINCAHPTHFEHIFEDQGAWVERIGGIRSNASRLSHQELDECDSLDSGDPVDLADRTRRLGVFLPKLFVFGGCCGTDERHIRALGNALSCSVAKV